jgi:hypothetical protein
VLDSDPEAAKRLREAFAKRTLELTGDLGIVGNRLSQIP